MPSEAIEEKVLLKCPDLRFFGNVSKRCPTIEDMNATAYCDGTWKVALLPVDSSGIVGRVYFFRRGR